MTNSKMTHETAVCALSSDELDAVNGGKVPVCTQTSKFSFMGLTFRFSCCDNGQKVGYVTH